MAKIANLDQHTDVKITKAFLNQLGATKDKSKIFIINAPTSIINQINGEEFDLDGIEMMIWSILEKLPKPKLRNLLRLAVYTVLKRFGEYHDYRRRTSNFLGIKPAAVSVWIKEFKKNGTVVEGKRKMLKEKKK